jgi:hypothetical protein
MRGAGGDNEPGANAEDGRRAQAKAHARARKNRAKPGLPPSRERQYPPVMRPQGWYPDPYGNHDERWFSDGRPTNLVRDQGAHSFDRPPPEALAQWRWWTVCLPALMALAVAGSFLSYAAFASAMNCLDGCSPVTAGRPVGSAGDILVVIAAVTLLVAGLTRPDWRRACAAGLWVAFALGCICAALIATSRPVASPGLASPPSGPAVATASLNAAACTAIGGRVVYSNATCFGVPYIADNGQRDYGEVWYGRDGQLASPANTVGTGATQAECESGRYPDGPTGPVKRPPGHWNAQLSFCMP